MSVLDEIEALKQTNEKSVTKQTDVMEDKFTTALQQATANTTDIKELAKDLTYLKSASDLQQNEVFKSTYEEEVGKQLLKSLNEEGKREAIIAAAKHQEAKNLRCKAYYDGMKPLFKTLGIEEPFGLVAMCITSILLMIPYLLVSLITFVINSINNIFTAVAKFTKPAYWLCSIVIVGAITIAIVLALIYGLDSFFGTSILSGIGANK